MFANGCFVSDAHHRFDDPTSRGGRIVATGTPEEVAGVEGSYTGRHLAGLVTPKAPRAKRSRPKKVPAAA